jgi:hypothetical protein
MVARVFYTSFSQWAFCRVMASNWLYPSNRVLQKIVDQGSIWKSVAHDSEIFNGKDVNSIFHTLGKPVRAALRTITLVFISAVIAPCGVVTHLRPLYQELKRYWYCEKAPDWEAEIKTRVMIASAWAQSQRAPPSFGLPKSRRERKWDLLTQPSKPVQPKTHEEIVADVIRKVEIEKKNHPSTVAWQRLTECGFAVASDLVCTWVAWVICYTVYRFFSIPAPIRNSFNLGVIASWDPDFSKLGKWLLGGSCVFFAFGCCPTEFLVWSTSTSQRASLYKSMQLKNQFGLVNPQGGFLSFDPSVDDENFDDKQHSHFRDLWISQACDVLEQIHKAQEILAEDFIPEHFPPRENLILRHLASVKARNGINSAEYRLLTAQFQTLFRNFNKISELFRDCMRIKHQDFMFENRMYLEPFPFTQESCLGAFEKVLPQQVVDIVAAIAEAKTFLCEDDNPRLQGDHLALYEKIKAAVHSGVTEADTYLVLGLAGWPATEKELKDQYKKCARALHPDKSDETFSKEATALFKCCFAAYTYGLKKVTPKEPTHVNRDGNLAIKN